MSQAAPPPTVASLAQRLRALPLMTRLVGCLAVALLLGAAAMSSRPRGHAQLVSLLAETRLQPLDLQRMRLGLARAGIVEAEVRNQQLWLPKEKLSAALKTIQEQNLLPGNLQTSALTAPQFSPFVSRYQQELQQQHQKKLAIQALLRRLSFVADASLEIDFLDTNKTQANGHTRCTITIQPLDGLYLEPAQLETIRQIALGSLSQLRREDLVIVDLAAGMAFDDQLMAQPQTAEQLKLISQLRSRQRLDRDIRQALADLGEMEIIVSSPCLDASVRTFNPGSVAEAGSDRARGLLPAAQRNLPGTNGTAAVSTVAGPTSPKSNLVPGAFESVAELSSFQPQVSIRLPSSTAASSSGSSASLARTMEQEQLRQEILRRLRPLLPEPAFGAADIELVRIEFLAPANIPEGQTGQNLAWETILGSRQSGLWIGVLSTAGLGFWLILSLRRRNRLEGSGSGDEPLAGEGNGREQQLRAQIDELLRAHPDTAANVIRDWIQKAA
ncbi:MAG: hypothetical protein ACK53V_16465 [Planctomycetota bacterium]